MNLTALRSLHVLARTGSVAATADEMGFTPSAVSQHIKRLESELGIELVERVGRGVVLTSQAEALTRHAPAVFAALEEARLAAIQAADTPSGTIRITAFATALRGLIAPALTSIRQQHPGLHVHVRELDPAECSVMVERGHAEVGVVHDWVGVPLELPPSLVRHAVAVDVADVLVSHQHRLATQSSVTASDLVNEPMLSSAPGSLCAAMYAQVFGTVSTPPRPVGFVHEYDTQIELVASGECLAIVPRLGRGPLPEGVVSVPFATGAPERTICLVWRQSSDGSAAIRAVTKALDDAVPTAGLERAQSHE